MAEFTLPNRSQLIIGAVLLNRWVYADGGVEQITADRNALKAAVISRLSVASVGQAGGPALFGLPAMGPFDDGETNQDWYGRIIRVPFKLIETPAQTSTIETDMKTWLESVFPSEDIQGPNRRFDFPPSTGDPANPAKCWAWELEYDE